MWVKKKMINLSLGTVIAHLNLWVTKVSLGRLIFLHSFDATYFPLQLKIYNTYKDNSPNYFNLCQINTEK